MINKTILKALACVFMLLMLNSSVAQALPSNYAGITKHINSSPIDSLKLNQIDAHLRTLNQNYSDSLLSSVFPALENKLRDKSYRLKAHLYNLLTASCYQLTGDITKAIYYNQQLIYCAEKAEKVFGSMWAMTQRMYLLAELDSTVSALKTALDLKRNIDVQPLTTIQQSHLKKQLCVFLQNIEQVDFAVEVCSDALAHNQKNNLTNGNSVILETTALLLESKGKSLKETIRLRKEAIHSAIVEKDSLNLRVVYRNLADDYSQLNQPDSALKYFQLTFEIHKKIPYKVGWLSDVELYAFFLIDQNRLTEAQKVIDTLSSQLIKNDSYLHNFYKLKAYYSAAAGDLDNFKLYRDKRDSIINSVHEASRIAELEELKVLYKTEKKELENKQLRAKSRSRLLLSLSLSALVLLLISLVIIVILKRKNEKRLFAKQQLVKEQKLEAEQNEKRAIAEKNEVLQNNLAQRIKQVVEQQLINAELMEVVEELRTTNESPIVRKKATQMKQQLNKSIKGQVYENIYKKMHELYPALLKFLADELGADKNHEIVSSAMYFLGYDSKTISAALNRTEKAIRNLRSRVRQKLGMETEDDFTEFLKKKNEELTNNS